MSSRIPSSLYSAHRAVKLKWSAKSWLDRLIANMEILEARRLLSVSASTMVGPFNTPGTQSTAELMAGGTVVDAANNVIVSPSVVTFS